MPATPLATPSLVVHQLLCGRDIAVGASNPLFQVAAQMSNFVYLIADTASKKCVAVDACWDVAGIYAKAKEFGLEVVACIYTHQHFDHIGGVMPRQMTRGKRFQVDGAAEVMARGTVLYCGKKDRKQIRRSLVEAAGSAEGVKGMLKSLKEGQAVPGTGGMTVSVMATPGHTPGSVCVLVAPAGAGAEVEAVVSGDTLFIGSIGRTDMPTSSVPAMLGSLHKLSELPGDAIVFPGHNYSPLSQSTIDRERKTNGFVQQAIQLAEHNRKKGLKPSPTSSGHWNLNVDVCPVIATTTEGEENDDDEYRGGWECAACRKVVQPILDKVLGLDARL